MNDNERYPRDPDPIQLEAHRPAITRRDFLARGLVSSAATVTAPNLLNLLLPARASAAPGDCTVTFGGSSTIPYIGFDLAGGANMAGSNVLVGQSGGQTQFLSARGYQRQGLPEAVIPSVAGQIAPDLGLLFHIDSAFFRGIMTKISTEAATQVNGVVFSARSNNDTDQNPHNPIYGIAKAGATGALVDLIGTDSSISGGNAMAPADMIELSLRPTRVSEPRDARGLVDTGKLVQMLGQQDAGAVMRASEAITGLKLGRMTESPETEEIIRCAFEQTTDLVGNFGDPNQLDPRNDLLVRNHATLPDIFSLADFDNSSVEKTATAMKLVMQGFAGAATVELGGYDYHNGTRASGEIRDFIAGQCMGATLEYAHRIGQPIMLYVFSDGSLSSNGQIDTSVDGRDKGVWTGDNSGTAAVFVMVYDPSRPGQRPDITAAAAGNQIGYHSMDGNVVTSANRISDSVTSLTEAIVLNYMALNGIEGSFPSLFPNHSLGDAGERQNLIGFQALS